MAVLRRIWWRWPLTRCVLVLVVASAGQNVGEAGAVQGSQEEVPDTATAPDTELAAAASEAERPAAAVQETDKPAVAESVMVEERVAAAGEVGEPATSEKPKAEAPVVTQIPNAAERAAAAAPKAKEQVMTPKVAEPAVVTPKVEEVPAPKPKHHWPKARGHPESYMRTNVTLTRNLNSSFAWKWHWFEGRFSTVVRGNPIIDSQKNILILAEQGLVKLDEHGNTLWVYRIPTIQYTMMNIVPSIMGDAVYGGANDGTAYAVDLWTGREIWSRRLLPPGKTTGGDTSYCEAHDGIVMMGIDISINHGGGNLQLMALNSTDGSTLWSFRMSPPTWNFNPLFPGDGTFIYMDVSGGVYRLNHRDGKKIWYSQPLDFQYSFTDGGVMIGPDGTAYACSNNLVDSDGALRAYRFSDGQLLWTKFLNTGCTSWPAIASSGDWGVLPAGHFVDLPLLLQLPLWMPRSFKIATHSFSLWMGPALRRLPGFRFIRALHAEILAFETKTGKTIWLHRLPDWERLAAKGDEEGVLERISRGRSPICLPTSFGTPTLSGDDTAYVGHASGLLYAVKDRDGDGRIDPATEVDIFDMDSGPLPNNAAWAPGMMAVASCDGLFVFKNPPGA